nr:hypothetical protein GCM10020093_018440 [Planobispora longispora]
MRLTLWDLTTGRSRGSVAARLGHADVVTAVAAVVMEGRPVAVTVSSGGYGEHVLRVWDLVTGRQIGEPLCPDFCSMTRMAAMSMDGWAVVVTEGDGQLWVWDVAADNRSKDPSSAARRRPVGQH